MTNKKSAANQWRQNCKKHADSGVFVSSDGQTVISEWYLWGSLEIHTLKLRSGRGGKLYIFRKSQDKCYDVDLLVMETYGEQMPQDGKDYAVSHKDGDIRNNALDNLEWKERALVYPNTHKATTAPNVNVDGFVVLRDGCIKRGSKQLTEQYDITDGVLRLCLPVDPYVTHRGRQVKMEDLMDSAGYIDGDPRHFKTPVVLHRDNNWLNFASDNLEWVDETDPRFQEYEKQKEEDMDEFGLVVNGKEKWQKYTDMGNKNP